MAEIVARDARGRAYTLSEEAAQEAFAAGDLRPESPEEAKERELQEKYGDSAFRAGAEGVARGVSFGLSDPLMVGLGADPEGLRERQERNPVAATGGEIVGAVGGSLIPGTAAFGAARLGSLGARVLSQRIGTAAASKLIGRAATGFTANAIEGALYGLGHTISESALGETELTAEKLLAGGGMGALIGGGTGAGFELLSGGLRAGFRGIRKGTKEIAEEAITAPTQAPGIADELAGLKLEPGAGAKLEGLAQKHSGKVREIMEDLGLDFPTPENLVLRDLDIKSGGMGRLQRKELGEVAPRMLLDDPRYAAAKRPREKVELIETIRKEAGEAYSDALSRIDGLANRGERFNPTAAAKRIRDEVLKPLEKGPALNRPIARKVLAEVERLEKAGKKELSFVNAEELKRSFDPHLKWDKASGPTAEQQALQKVRGIISSEIENQAEDIAIRANDLGIFDNWKQAKERYAAMAELGDVAQQRLNARETNRVFSLTDNIVGSAAGVAGVMAGGLPGIAMAAGGALLNKWGRERLPHILALHLDRVSRSPALKTAASSFAKSVKDIERKAAQAGSRSPFGAYSTILTSAAARGAQNLFAAHAALHEADPEYRDMMAAAGFPDETPEQRDLALRRGRQLDRLGGALMEYDAKLDGAVDGVLSGKSSSRRAERAQKAINQRIEELSELVANPEALLKRLDVGEFLAEVAPGASAAVVTAATRGLSFLHEKAPKSPYADTVPALRRPWEPSDHEIERWERHVGAVQDPLTVLEDMSRGEVTQEAVEALQAVYPSLYADVVARIQERISGLEEPLEYEQRISLGALFGAPLDESAQPETFAMLQSLHNAPTPEPQMGGRPMRVADASTRAQRIEARGGQRA